MTSDVLEHKWRESLTDLYYFYMNDCDFYTEVLKNKVQFFKLAYLVKEFQCHSNNSATAWIEGKKQQQNNTRYLKVFFVIFFS